MKKLILLFTLLFSFGLSAQDIQFKTVVSKKKVGQFERFRVDFTINKSGGGQITPPDFSMFAFLGGPSTSVSSSWVNGTSTYTKKYSYYLMPKNVGKFTIASARIKVDGMMYRTKPVVITVVKDKPKSENPRDPATLASNSIHLKMVFNDATPYVNQQITATYYLYFKTNISTPQLLELPKFNGFWSQEFDQPKRFIIEDEYIDDELYKRIILKKVTLIPQKSGKLVLSPLTVEVPVEISTGRLDFFGNQTTRQYNYTTSTGKRTINVKSLPQEGKPTGFTGAVGNFKFSVKASKTTVEANESITIKALVKGTGNIKLFSLPKLNVPDELEAYDPKHIEKSTLGKYGMSGKISDEYIIIPRYKGGYKIPALEFSYFNPTKAKYVTIKGDDFVINVTKGNSKIASDSDNVGLIRGKSDVQMIGKDIRFIHSKAEFEEVTNNNFFGTLLYYLLLILPFLAFPLIVFLYKQKKKSDSDIAGSKKRNAGKVAKKMLFDANKALQENDDAKFYEAVENAMYKYLGHSLGIDQSNLNQENIKVNLQKKGVSDSVIKEILNLISDCEMARYAPSLLVENKQDVYNKASELILKLEK